MDEAGAVEAIRALNDRGYYVLRRQRSVRRARSTLPAGGLRRLNAAMQERLALEGAHVDRFCAEPDFAADQAIDAGKRKPVSNPFLEAMDEWPIVAERSFFVGVSGDNIEAARSAGICRASLCGATSRTSSIRFWLRSARSTAPRASLKAIGAYPGIRFAAAPLGRFHGRGRNEARRSPA